MQITVLFSAFFLRLSQVTHNVTVSAFLRSALDRIDSSSYLLQFIIDHLVNIRYNKIRKMVNNSKVDAI